MRMRIRGPDPCDLGSGMEKFGSGINILDPVSLVGTIDSLVTVYGQDSFLCIKKNQKELFAIHFYKVNPL